ncbi:glutamate 5-kinase [Loktanella sp. D2R18]|uniref:glutamate 5-kinase n=1 Tax=Rhodobacterales TaxID=204455 RepID=UPI000DE82102|nr:MULTISPECIES: glutamate 5-kinase [Rhodobacterales]MDO6591609.1 glutamate 5-kinase [Yoonia sp. 1_MG-2023]RBW43724.1 glutamate 5-kinase [Loktanella sp. D2R18]
MAALTGAKRLVVKIGSALLVDAETGALRQSWLTSLAADVARIRARGTDVVLVSSGSIALGRGVLDLPASALPLEQSQAAAAVGQIRLARAYEGALAEHAIIAGQVLVTLEDSHDRRRYLNSRATMETMLSLGVTPIVNENDTIATDEIRYGDNDRLAAQVAVTIGADQLILLSDVDGLYTANPRVSSDAKHIDIVDKITPEIEDMAGDVGSGLSKGGMITKIMAARMATEAGCAMAIALGTENSPLAALEAGARTTWFAAQTDPQAARKRWIASMKPAGSVTIDAGAKSALICGKSLLPAGICGVAGQFGRGDVVAILDAQGTQLGQGLTRYTAAETRLIMGRRSDEMTAVLGYEGRAALVHRDDMVL